MLTNRNSPAEGNFCNEGKAIKQLIVMDYNHHTGYVDRVTGWSTVTPSAGAHLSGRKSCSFIC